MVQQHFLPKLSSAVLWTLFSGLTVALGISHWSCGVTVTGELIVFASLVAFVLLFEILIARN